MDFATVTVVAVLVIAALVFRRVLRFVLIVAAVGFLALRFGFPAPGIGRSADDLLHFLPSRR